MPIDAVGAVAEAAIVSVTEPPRRGRFRRILYWSVAALVAGLLFWAVYLALS